MLFRRSPDRAKGGNVARSRWGWLAAVGLTIGAAFMWAGAVPAVSRSARFTPTAHAKHAATTIVARLFARVAPLDPPGPQGHVTVLEGPAFGPDGELDMVHPTAPAGQAKVIALNVRTRHTRAVYARLRPPNETGIRLAAVQPDDPRHIRDRHLRRYRSNES